MIKRIAGLVAAAATAMMLTVAAQAQEIAPEHLALAKRYVVLTDTGALFQRTILQTAQESVDHLVQQNPEIGEDILAGARDVAKEYLQGDNLVHDNFARIYAVHYTMDELTQIIAFYETDVGKKILAGNIEINKNLQTAARVAEENLSTEFAVRLRSHLKEKGFDL
ncbi:DUF2059 domain-containing protein [Maritalea sp.]|uniref:DUF2059 domain-containing protein n=1 Tax=Maritalea sp. TaxID=2003361 RepID=UPI003EF3F036